MAQNSLINIILAALAVGSTIPSVGFGADMRDCKLDALTFFDPWVGRGQFTVERVGETLSFWCVDGDGIGAKTKKPTDAANCRGPFGDLLLEGSFDRSPNEMTVIWSVIAGVPCCGWEAYPTSQVPARHLSDVEWFPKGTAPALGSLPSVLIEAGEYGPITIQLLPLDCKHDLP